MLGYVLEELGLQAASLHSRLNQRRRLAALHRFKSGEAGRTASTAATPLPRYSPAVDPFNCVRMSAPCHQDMR
jgi:hypothetical protein